MSVAGKGRRLILHFDINKTIVMRDSIDHTPSVTLTVLTLLIYDPYRSVTY